MCVRPGQSLLLWPLPLSAAPPPQVDDELEIKAYYAGHVLGAAMFQIKVGSESVVYTVGGRLGAGASPEAGQPLHHHFPTGRL